MEAEILVVIIILGALYYYFYIFKNNQNKWDLIIKSNSLAQFNEDELIISNDKTSSLFCESDTKNGRCESIKNLRDYDLENKNMTLIATNSKNHSETYKLLTGNARYNGNHCRIPILGQIEGEELDMDEVFTSVVMVFHDIDKNKLKLINSKKNKSPRSSPKECKGKFIKLSPTKCSKNKRRSKSKPSFSNILKYNEQLEYSPESPTTSSCNAKTNSCKTKIKDNFGCSTKFLNNNVSAFDKPKGLKIKNNPSGCDVSSLF